MNKVTIILIIIALVASGCKQKPDKSAAEAGSTDSLIVNDSVIDALTGVDSLEGSGGEVDYSAVLFDSLYKRMPLLSLPVWFDEYKYPDSMFRFREFIRVPDTLCSTFLLSKDYGYYNLRTLKLPEHKNIKVIIASAYSSDSEESALYLCTFRNNRLISRLRIYGVGEVEYEGRTDMAVRLTSFSITASYDVTVKNTIRAGGEDVKVLEQRTFKISEDGKLIIDIDKEEGVENLPRGTYVIDDGGQLMISTDEEPEGDSFVKRNDWKGVKCKWYNHIDGYENVQECTFPNANMRQVYNIVKRIDVNLKTELPAANLEYVSNAEGGFPNIEYKYKSNKHLLIELFYAGGVTHIEIIENGSTTQSKIRDLSL